MASNEWVQHFPAAITVCDTDGIILEMNAHAVKSFADEGGANLIGTNVLDCHPESRHLLQSSQRGLSDGRSGGCGHPVCLDRREDR